VDSYSKRKNIIILIILLVGGAFVIRLFNLQVINSTYKKWATNNILREKIDYPLRGLIYDRNGELLVYNEAVYDLMVVPRETSSFDTLALCELVEVSKEDFVESLRAARSYSLFRSSVVVKQVSPQNYAITQEKMYRFPGFYFQTRTIRNYKHNIAAHVLGYIREVSAKHVYSGSYYRSGDYIGDGGIEKYYEDVLRGRKGISYRLVDVHGREKGAYLEGESDTLSEKGKDLISTLDWELQAYAEKLMQNKAGSVVAIEPSTGEILVLLSSPAYDPTTMVGRNRMKAYPEMLADPLLPLYNRAISAQYPPGSTFKMAQGLVALQEEIITPYTAFGCAMGYHSGNFHQKCHHNGAFTLSPAIAQSCNAYFSHTFRSVLEARKYGGVKNGYEAWRKHMLSMGFGVKVAPEFDDEKAGFIPTTEYYQNKIFKNSAWRALPIISLSIGQGEVQTTPMQMANYAALLANRGFYYPPHVVRWIEDVRVNPEFSTKRFTTINPDHFENVVEGMEWVVTQGTGRSAAIDGVVVCGKTGTAQNPHGADHSTFIAFAPKYNPKIAISVYVENGKWGASYAAPIAGLIMEKYLTDTLSVAKQWVEQSMLDANLLYPDKPNYIKYPSD
jgi:penicillin-binding protein 2